LEIFWAGFIASNMATKTTLSVLGLPLLLIYFFIRNAEALFTHTSLTKSSLALAGGVFYLCFLFSFALFKLYIYPFYFSPLRNLPEPKVCSPSASIKSRKQEIISRSRAPVGFGHTPPRSDRTTTASLTDDGYPQSPIKA